MSWVEQRKDLVPSALGWSDTVPASWHVMPCRAIVEEKTEKNENAVNQNYLSLMANVGIIPYEEKGDVGNKKPEDLSKCKLVMKGDLVINSMNYGIGSYGLSNLDGVCSPVYIILKPKSDVVHERYALRIFESKSFQKYAQSFGIGILEHRAAIGWDDLKNIKVGIPTLEEQQWLLDYLDRETTRIDSLITKKTRFIELLREKRQALITHAVTKGLDPNVKMKDSGVEWLGEVPEHWSVTHIKRLVSSISQGWSPECEARSPEEGEWGVLKVGCVNGGKFRVEESKALPNSLEPRPELSVREGDVLVSRANTRELVGSCAVVPRDFPQIMLCDKLYRLIAEPRRVLPEFLAALIAVHGRRMVEIEATGASSSMVNIAQSVIMDLPVAVPQVTEQRVIVTHLQSSVIKLDRVVTRTERSIELLKERRSALITAAVTGQIDLREAA